MIQTKQQPVLFCSYASIIIVVLLSCTIQADVRRSPVFSKQFLQKAKPHHTPASHQFHSNTDSSPQTPSLTSTDLNRYISYCACVFALVKIIWKYKQLYYNSQQKNDSYLMYLLNACVPSCVFTMATHQQLLCYALETTIEALIYKTIAQCLVTCVYDSLFDVGKKICKKLSPF